MIPTTLAEWSITAIEDLLTRGIFESETFDFKKELPHSNDKNARSKLRQTCCAFANSEGGFLVYGIAANRDLAPIDRLIGIPSSKDFPIEFGSFPKECTPSIFWDMRNPPLTLSSGSVLHIIHIPRSWRGPHGVQNDERWQFAKRTNRGVEPMTYEEIRMGFTGHYERRRKLRLIREELTRLQREATAFIIPENAPTILTHDAGELNLAVIEAVMADSYLILEQSPSLLADLSLVRQLARTLTHATARYYQSLLQLRPGHHSAYNLKQHNLNARNWINEFDRLTTRCIQELDKLTDV